MFTCFLTVTNLELNSISYVISGDHFKLFPRPKITGNQVLKTNLPGFPIWVLQNVMENTVKRIRMCIVNDGNHLDF